MTNHQATGELYEPDPGKVDRCFCGICGEEMDVKRNNPPGHGFASAIVGHNRRYDKFWCKNRSEKWHRQAVHLKQEISKTASRKIADMLKEEVEEIIRTKQHTKENGYYF